MSVQAEEEAIKLFAEFYYSSKYIALVNVARTTAIISIVGSACIIYDIFQKQAWQSTANRIILCMSVCDIIFSLVATVLGTVMMPVDSAWGSLGNWETCKAQGFLTEAFLQPACFLNTNLAIYYVICVRLGWREDKFRHPFIQFWLFGLPFLLGIANGIWGLVDGAYTVSLWSCNLAPSPLGCMEMPEVVGECTRGLHAHLIEQIWTYILMAFTLIIIVSVIILYWSVLEKERRNDRYTTAINGQQGVNRKLSNRVAMQGVYFSFCFLLTYSFYYVWFFGYDLRGQDPPYWLLVMLAITIPLGGFFNAFVYFRRNKPSDAETAKGIWQSIKSTVSVPKLPSNLLSKTTSKLSSTSLSNLKSANMDESSSPAYAELVESTRRVEIQNNNDHNEPVEEQPVGLPIEDTA